MAEITPKTNGKPKNGKPKNEEQKNTRTLADVRKDYARILAEITSYRVKDAEGKDTDELTPEALDVLTYADAHEPSPLQTLKSVMFQFKDIGKRPADVTIPMSEQLTYEMWANADTHATIEKALKDAKKDDVLKKFKDKQAHDKVIGKYDDAAKSVRADVDALQRSLSQAVANITGVKRPATPAATPGEHGRNSKVTRGTPGAPHFKSTFDEYEHVSRKQAWLVKNVRDRYTEKGHADDTPDTDDIIADMYTYDENGVKIPWTRE